jgi:hypothetical protein
MSRIPTEAEISHGITLLRDTQNWKGHVAVIPVDPVCRWNQGGGTQVCGDPVENAVVLLSDAAKAKVGDPVEVIVFCKHHTNCLVEAVGRWRRMS